MAYLRIASGTGLPHLRGGDDIDLAAAGGMAIEVDGRPRRPEELEPAVEANQSYDPAFEGPYLAVEAKQSCDPAFEEGDEDDATIDADADPPSRQPATATASVLGGSRPSTPLAAPNGGGDGGGGGGGQRVAKYRLQTSASGRPKKRRTKSAKKNVLKVCPDQASAPAPAPVLALALARVPTAIKPLGRFPQVVSRPRPPPSSSSSAALLQVSAVRPRPSLLMRSLTHTPLP